MIRAESRLKPVNVAWLLALLATAALRLAHVNLLWSDEDYHLAAAIQLLHGRLPYRDFWYDKPPLAALFYSLIGGYSGWPLRLLGIVFVLACCWLAYRLAARWWGQPEGRAAALSLAFFTAFYLPSATVPFAVDGLLLLPHLAAIYFAKERRPFWSGICCAAGLLTNIKAVFVVATCALWLLPNLTLFSVGVALPLGIAAATGAALGLLPDFYQQVWQWGLIYARGATASNPLGIALKNSADWLAFHAALLAGFLIMIRQQTKTDQFKLTVWFVLSFVALLFGNHFAPRYFFQLLPVLVIAGARGMVFAISRYGRLAVTVFALLLLVPLIRFGPRYTSLVWLNLKHRQTTWADAALDIDSQQVALIINERKHPSDTLFVWGYRPDVYVYTRLLPPGKFWDSQPLDGVPADRHLLSSQAILTGAARENRALFVQSRPAFVVDGLGMLNPALAPEKFAEIAAWLRHYRLIRQTSLSRIYQRMS